MAHGRGAFRAEIRLFASLARRPSVALHVGSSVVHALEKRLIFGALMDEHAAQFFLDRRDLSPPYEALLSDHKLQEI